MTQAESRNRWQLIAILAAILVAVLIIILWLFGGRGRIPAHGAYLTDDSNSSIQAIELGASLKVGARGLQANTLYEVRLLPGEEGSGAGEPISFARVSTDRQGTVEPFPLWYQSGVVGCSLRSGNPEKLPPYLYRDFDDAERALSGQTLRLTMSPVRQDPTGRTPQMELSVAEPEVRLNIPFRKHRSAMLYPSDPWGCLQNSALTGDENMYVSGRHFRPGEMVEVSVVPNQRVWFVGDPINDVTGVGGVAAPVRVRADETGRFTVHVWDRSLQRRGTYDLVAQRLASEGQRPLDRIDRRAVISYASDTGYILYLRYPPSGPLMDVAGRPITGSPYFQFADSFAETGDPVWAAVDPTYVPDSHPGGRYAAYYVVDHRDVNGWDPSAGGATDLVDKSGGAEIVPVKAGCINGTDFKIWENALKPGKYDVVVNFGSTPAETATQFNDDLNYNSNLDFLDGADQVGFVVAKDPYERGSFPIGEASYSTDDYFPTLTAPGTPGLQSNNVDLRAVVRYPATIAGVDQSVAAGQHPIFVIEHGNHSFCDVAGYTRATCPNRTLNHEGYMELLNILASHGIIAVSIDAYDLTGPNTITPQWIPERADLILKHLELWSHMNSPTTYTSYPDYLAGRFNNHVDFNKISVSGHSRGGEASVGAYMRNTDFNISSVSSIAPVDGKGYILADVPYFVILPAADGDVANLNGMKIYDRAGQATTPVDATTKNSIHVYGANHNFFNTVWADDGDDSWTQRDDYINKADQQRIGEAYLAAFARTHLLDDTTYSDMFRGRLTFPSTAGFKIYPTRHEKQHAKLDSGTGSGTPSGSATATSVTNPSVHSTTAVRLTWSSAGDQYTYTVPLGQQDTTSFEVLSFRAAQTNSSTNPASGSQEFQVELINGAKARAIYTGRFDAIPKPYNRSGSHHNVMTSVRIPLQSFIVNKSGVNLGSIDTVRFQFANPSQGEIYVDDVEFSR